LKIAAVSNLEFLRIRNLAIRSLLPVSLCYDTKVEAYWIGLGLIRCGDMAERRIFNMAAIRHFEFLKFISFGH